MQSADKCVLEHFVMQAAAYIHTHGQQALLCILAWDAWYSVFILVGICINTYCMSLADPQTVRKSILVTSPLVLIYDLFARSVGGTVYEAVALCSAVIGILRNRKS